jgi:hypothetical protein
MEEVSRYDSQETSSHFQYNSFDSISKQKAGKWPSGSEDATPVASGVCAGTHLFLCGHPAMVEAMKTMLEAEDYTIHSPRHPGQIHLEKYW